MAEPNTEDAGSSSADYVQRIATFLEKAGGWCGARGLTVECDAVTLREEHTAAYDAPRLSICKDGASIARIVPVGSKIIGAHGRIDLIGRVTRHAFLFYVGKAPAFPTQTVAGGKSATSSSAPMLPGVDGDGWYWIEARVRRARRVEEGLFLDLLTDVSDHEF